MNTKQTTTKKTWTKPQILVLVRSKPEEAVLATCKNTPTDSSSPGNFFLGCISEFNTCGSDCSSTASS